ncbi:hypothetical protein, partial [Mycoplasma todarodis]
MKKNKKIVLSVGAVAAVAVPVAVTATNTKTAGNQDKEILAYLDKRIQSKKIEAKANSHKLKTLEQEKAKKAYEARQEAARREMFKKKQIANPVDSYWFWGWDQHTTGLIKYDDKEFAKATAVSYRLRMLPINMIKNMTRGKVFKKHNTDDLLIHIAKELVMRTDLWTKMQKHFVAVEFDSELKNWKQDPKDPNILTRQEKVDGSIFKFDNFSAIVKLLGFEFMDEAAMKKYWNDHASERDRTFSLKWNKDPSLNIAQTDRSQSRMTLRFDRADSTPASQIGDKISDSTMWSSLQMNMFKETKQGKKQVMHTHFNGGFVYDRAVTDGGFNPNNSIDASWKRADFVQIHIDGKASTGDTNYIVGRGPNDFRNNDKDHRPTLDSPEGFRKSIKQLDGSLAIQHQSFYILDITSVESIDIAGIEEGILKAKIHNQGFKTAKEIADAINNAKTTAEKKFLLGKYFGMKVTSVPDKVFAKITVTGDSNGNMALDVEYYKSNHFAKTKTTSNKSIKALSDAQIKELIGNDDQKTNHKLVDDAFNPKLKISDATQGDRTAAEIAKTITNAKDLAKLLGVDESALSKSLKGKGKMTKVDIDTDANGNMTIKVTVNTPDATKPPLDNVFKIKVKSDATIATQIADKLQKKNEAAVKAAMAKPSVKNQGDRKMSEVAKSVTDLGTLKKELDLDIKVPKGSTVTVKVTVDSKDSSKVKIDVTVTTKGASTETHHITKEVSGKDDSTIDTQIADKKQTKNNADIDALLKKAQLKNQGDKKGSEIAKDFNKKSLADKLKDLRDKFGVDLTGKSNSNGTKITDVKLTADPKTGKIKIEVKTETKNATNATKSPSSHDVTGKNDVEIDANINKPKEIAAIVDFFKKAKLTKQGTRTIDEIVAAWNKMSLDDKLNAIKDETGVDVPKTQGNTTISNLVFSKGNGATIDVKISTTTAHATTASGSAKATITGDDDATVMQRRKVVAADKKQKTSIATIKKIIDGIDIKKAQGKNTVSSIQKIVDDMKKAGKSIGEILKAIKNATGVNIPTKVGDTSITGVKLTADPKTGKIKVEVTTKTPDATKNPSVDGSLSGTNDIDLTQKKNIEAIEAKLNGVDIKGKQGSDTIAEIIKKMKKAGASVADIIKSIKAITGVDLSTGHKGTDITGVTLVDDGKGGIKVTVSTNTKGATTPTTDAKGSFVGNNDKAANATKLKDKNNADIAKRIHDVDIKTKQGTKTVKEIADIVKKGKANGDSIDKILDAIKNATGVDLASGHKGTKITD